MRPRLRVVALLTASVALLLPSGASANPGSYVGAGATQSAYSQGDACVATVTASTTPSPTASTGASAAVQAVGSVVCTRSIDTIAQTLQLYVRGSLTTTAPGLSYRGARAANMQFTFNRLAADRTVRYCATLRTASPAINKLVCAETTPPI